MGQKSSKLRRSKSAATSSAGKPGAEDTISRVRLIELEQQALQASKLKVDPEHPEKSSKLRRSESAATGSAGKPGAKDTISRARLVELGQQALQASKVTVGPEHPETLSRMFELGWAYHGDLKAERALRVFQNLLPLREKVLGADHADTLTTLDAVAEELCNLDGYEQCLGHLIELKERCQRSTGKQSERSIAIGIDVAGVMKLLGKVKDADKLLLDLKSACIQNLGAKHPLTLAIANDLRHGAAPDPPDRREWEELLRLNGFSIPTEIFPNTLYMTFPQLIASESLSIYSTIGYEASIAVMLRLGPINGRSAAVPLPDIPPHKPDPSKVSLVKIADQTHRNSSFQSLVDRSIAMLPTEFGSETQAARQAANKHIAFLKSMKSLQELLMSNQNPFWFFQRRRSFLEQRTIQQWSQNSLEQYVLLPIEGGFVNSEDCIFISHYWQTPEHPDPDGSGLRKLQDLLLGGFWKKAQYVWVDWTCLPQGNRTAPEQRYFDKALQTIPRLVRECSFVAAFKEFRPRIWIILEVASYIFDRHRSAGLPCTDTFKAHLVQMKGDGVKSVLEKYNYSCSTPSDYKMVVNWLEILLNLCKTVPSVNTRRKILNAINNPGVRACTHKESDAAIDKERGIFTVKGEIVLFNPIHVEEDAIEIFIPGDFEARLKEAHRRADESFDDAGVREMAREYDRTGDYSLGEALYRRTMIKNNTYTARSGLLENLEQQGQFEKALAQVKRDIGRGVAPDEVELQKKLVSLHSKQAEAEIYRKWVSQPLVSSLDVKGASEQVENWKAPNALHIRLGLRRNFLQRLDMSILPGGLDPITVKSLEEECLQMEASQELWRALYLHWGILKLRKDALGPTHPDTRRNLLALARVSKKLNHILYAHKVYTIALSVCDSSLGPLHPESRAVLASLAEVCLLEKKPGLARSYFRQLLERSLAVAAWDSDETYQAKYFLQALIPPNSELKIHQLEESTKVDIVGRNPHPPKRVSSTKVDIVDYDLHPPKRDSSTKEDRDGQEEGGRLLRKADFLIDLENADIFLGMAILAC